MLNIHYISNLTLFSITILCLSLYAAYVLYDYFYRSHPDYDSDDKRLHVKLKKYFATLLLTAAVIFGIYFGFYPNSSSSSKIPADDTPHSSDYANSINQPPPPPVFRDPLFTCDVPPLILRLSGRPQLIRPAVDNCIDRSGICRNVLRALCHAGAHSDPLNVCIQQTRNQLPVVDVKLVTYLLSTRMDCGEELEIWSSE